MKRVFRLKNYHFGIFPAWCVFTTASQRQRNLYRAVGGTFSPPAGWQILRFKFAPKSSKTLACRMNSSRQACLPLVPRQQFLGNFVRGRNSNSPSPASLAEWNTAAPGKGLRRVSRGLSKTLNFTGHVARLLFDKILRPLQARNPAIFGEDS